MKYVKVEKKLDHVFDKYEKKRKSGGMAFLVEDETGEFSWQKEVGDLRDNHKFATASVTKLYATAILLKLVDEGRCSLDDRISKYLPTDVVSGLHIYKGTDYSFALTVRQLIAQTSGLPDYFTVGIKGDVSVLEKMALDLELGLEEYLTITKKLKPRFAPDTKGKAYYSDINFDLIGLIIENITSITVEDNYKKYIFGPLNLINTYMFTKGMEFDFPGFWMKGHSYKIPNLLAGWPTSGSIISTKTEMMIFLKAFWSGRLFDSKHYEEMGKYHYLQFFPMQYGLGHMRFNSYGAPEIIGHSGSTGVLCYYVPKYKVYITGCINEFNEQKATRFVMRLAHCCRGMK